MTDPAQLAALDGQQYLVLRPVRDVASFYRAERAAVLAGLPRSVSSPNTGHVTLRGFAESDRPDHVAAVVAEWAREQGPITLRVDGVDGFPPPFSVIIARLERTPTLLDSYARLTRLLEETDLVRLGELGLDEWVFHLSLAYCGGLDAAAWDDAHARTARVVAELPTEVIMQAELVWYESGAEHTTVVPFGGRPSS